MPQTPVCDQAALVARHFRLSSSLWHSTRRSDDICPNSKTPPQTPHPFAKLHISPSCGYMSTAAVSGQHLKIMSACYVFVSTALYVLVHHLREAVFYLRCLLELLWDVFSVSIGVRRERRGVMCITMGLLVCFSECRLSSMPPFRTVRQTRRCYALIR